ncbi:CusA/CzcA family heavy metal efflux RND transporter [Coraliomargarita sinensis]|uniref:CusA/CzcA family heavy metal efflux RND transporter n=1 Tax=Coraliomargarita sinensis TaxID=2174842 RepID=A0A317ZCZ9_9BACT|nr:CusA/CzcA family heavy metal efflux RND transporter [Coraliomargarita sinensis]PXA03006.1 CusA/CzcA family heavy metal efflux RND transporter [Coraliomargarita sinensis]
MFEKIIDLALRNKLVVVLLTAAVIAGGYWSYKKLPVDAFPDVSPALVQVFTVTSGLGPEEVEKFVTFPVEAAMSGLPKVEEIRSVSNFGLSVVSVYFEEGTDIYFARQVVGERLSEAREAIPEGFGEPEMGPISTGQGLVLYYNLIDTTGEYSLEELRTFQDWIVKYNLQTVPGVTEVLGIGGFVKQFQVNIDPDALLRYNIPLHEVIERIEANNQNVGGQFIERNGEMYIVRSEGLARDIRDLQRIVITHEDGTPVYLEDVAQVEIGGEIRQGLQTRNGEEEVVSGMVIKLYGTNSSTVIEAVEAKLAEIEKALPEGVVIDPYYQQKRLVESSVNTVTTALLQGIGLVVLILLIFIGGFRPSLVVSLAIPFSVLFATTAMYYFGISANLMSLGGLAIAIGMMVDGTIVMVENSDRLLWNSDPGESKLHVILRACEEVAKPITFAILIVVLVFIPLFTLRGVEGNMFRPLAFTVSLAMFGSLIYALIGAPVYTALFMRKPKAVRSLNVQSASDSAVDAPASGHATEKNREIWIVRCLVAIYRPLVSLFVRFRFLAIVLAVAMLAVGAWVFPKLGSEFTPRLMEGDVIANLSMAPSVSLEETKRNSMIAEKRLLEIPEIEQAISRIGRGEVGAHADPINSVHMMVVLKPKNEWRKDFTQVDIENAMREALAGMPGVQVNITQPIQLSVDELIGGSKAQLAIKLFGDDLDVLKAQGDAIAAVVGEIEGAADVQTGQVIGSPQIVVRPNREAIARHGLNLAEVQELIEAAVGGVGAGQIYEGVQRYDIYVRYREEARDTVDDLRHLIVQTEEGAYLPLDEVATIKEIVGPRQIIRENNQRYLEIQANVVGRDIGGFVEEAQAAIDAELTLPPGYLISWGGQYELQQEANARLAIVVPVTLALIALLIYMSFGSIKNTVLILLNIPLALVGGVVGLWLAGENLSVPSSIGFIALFGIALGNGMVLITYLNQLYLGGKTINETSVEGACLRVRPVLMTAGTTLLGLLPLLLATGTGSEVQRPLAVVVVGGLVSSTILTLLVLPALYKWFAINPQRLEHV